MGYRDYLKNPMIYDINGRRRPGSITRSNPNPTFSLNKKDPAKADRENRELVVDKIKELINNKNNKITLEQACNQIAQDETITSKFSYLFGSSNNEKRSEEDIKKIEQVYLSWYNGKTRQRKEVEKGLI